MQRFMRDQIVLRSWKSTRTRTSKSFRICSTSPRSWYTVKPRFWMWKWLNVHLLHGRDRRWLIMLKRSSGQRQKYESIQICFYVWEKWRILQMQIEDGKVKWDNCNKLNLTENYLELMENRLRSSRICSQDLRHWKSFEKSIRHLNKTMNLKIVKLEPSSCECSMIMIGPEEEIQNNVCQIPNKSRTTGKITQGTWHFLVLEAKRSGMENQITFLKENDMTQPTWCGTIRGILTTSIQRCFSAGSWNLEEEEQQGDHFSADASNTALQDRTNHSAHQLSI